MNQPTKILFLDIDGVLNSRRTASAFDGYPHTFDGTDMDRFDHVAITLMRRLCKETDCAVVLSSDWRYTCSVHETANALDLPVIGATPMMGNVSRGTEINAWLTEHANVEVYAIVDDIAQMLPSQQSRFVQTDELFGLSLTNYCDLKRILGVIEEPK